MGVPVVGLTCSPGYVIADAGGGEKADKNSDTTTTSVMSRSARWRGSPLRREWLTAPPPVSSREVLIGGIRKHEYMSLVLVKTATKGTSTEHFVDNPANPEDTLRNLSTGSAVA